MQKFCVFSGFLGAGKTTAMMALTKDLTAHGTKAAMISNDLGHGVTLADDRLARLAGCNASELTETCICYQNEALADRIDAAFHDGCSLVISDIPGFGVGALEHVYHGLTEKFPGKYALAPFTVLIEPDTVETLRSGGGEVRYILHTQLVEADLIVLNKCDTIDASRREADLALLREAYPSARCIALSARTGEGLDALADALLSGEATLRRPDIGYGGADFAAAMGKISEAYLEYHAQVCCNDFDGTAYLLAIAERVRDALAASAADIPHLKLLAWEPEGDYGKVDLIGAARPIELTRVFERPCTELAVILNASAVCPAAVLRETISEAVKAVSEAYQLELLLFKEECFGMGG